MKIDVVKIKELIVHAPLHFLIPAIVLVLVLGLAGVRLIWFSHRAPVAPLVASQAAPAPAASVPAAKLAAVPTSAPATPAVSAATSSGTAQANALMVEPPMPGVPAPEGLVEGKALYTLESSPAQAGDVKPTWSEVGHKLVDARAASFQTLSVKDLDSLLPSSGQVRESWSFWVRVGEAGDWVAAVKAGGYYHSSVTVQIDGLDIPALNAQPWNNVVNVVSPIRLGSGWHQVTIRFSQTIRQDPATMHGTAELFWRGPADAAPTAIIPGAVDPSKVQSIDHEASDGERSGAPAGAMSSGSATAAHPASSAHGGVK